MSEQQARRTCGECAWACRQGPGLCLCHKRMRIRGKGDPAPKTCFVGRLA